MQNVFKKLTNLITFIFLIIPALLPYLVFIFKKALFIYQDMIIFIKAPKIFINKTHTNAGGWQELYYYFKYKTDCLETKDNLTLITRNHKYFYLKLFLSLFGNKNIIVGGCASTSLVFLLFAYSKKNTLVHTAGTKWAYDASEKQASKLKIYLVDKIHKNNTILCVSKHQQQFLKNKFGNNIKMFLMYVCIGSTSLELKRSNNETNIIMIGTIQKRKGVDLYSKLADLAKANNQRWNFYWMGSSKNWTNQNNYLSNNVTFLKYNNDANAILKQIDIFFLSSIDEPCSLAVLEALNKYKKVIVYKHTGSAELIDNIKGCGVYANYNINEAYKVLQRVISEPLDKDKIKLINNNISSSEGFAKRLDNVLENHWKGR